MIISLFLFFFVKTNAKIETIKQKEGKKKMNTAKGK